MKLNPLTFIVLAAALPITSMAGSSLIQDSSEPTVSTVHVHGGVAPEASQKPALPALEPLPPLPPLEPMAPLPAMEPMPAMAPMPAMEPMAPHSVHRYVPNSTVTVTGQGNTWVHADNQKDGQAYRFLAPKCCAGDDTCCDSAGCGDSTQATWTVSVSDDDDEGSVRVFVNGNHSVLPLEFLEQFEELQEMQWEEMEIELEDWEESMEIEFEGLEEFFEEMDESYWDELDEWEEEWEEGHEEWLEEWEEVEEEWEEQWDYFWDEIEEQIEDDEEHVSFVEMPEFPNLALQLPDLHVNEISPLVLRLNLREVDGDKLNAQIQALVENSLRLNNLNHDGNNLSTEIQAQVETALRLNNLIQKDNNLIHEDWVSDDCDQARKSQKKSVRGGCDAEAKREAAERQHERERDSHARERMEREVEREHEHRMHEREVHEHEHERAEHEAMIFEAQRQLEDSAAEMMEAKLVAEERRREAQLQMLEFVERNAQNSEEFQFDSRGDEECADCIKKNKQKNKQKAKQKKNLHFGSKADARAPSTEDIFFSNGKGLWSKKGKPVTAPKPVKLFKTKGSVVVAPESRSAEALNELQEIVAGMQASIDGLRTDIRDLRERVDALSKRELH